MEQPPNSTSEQVPTNAEQVRDDLKELARMNKLQERVREGLRSALIYSGDRRFEFIGLLENGDIQLRQVEPAPSTGLGDLKVDPGTFGQMFTIK